MWVVELILQGLFQEAAERLYNKLPRPMQVGCCTIMVLGLVGLIIWAVWK